MKHMEEVGLHREQVTMFAYTFGTHFHLYCLLSFCLLGKGNGTPLPYSCLENPMDGGAWWAAVLGVAKSQTWLSDFTFTLHFYALEKEMATPSSILAWRIPGMGSHRVRHNWWLSSSFCLLDCCTTGKLCLNVSAKTIISLFLTHVSIMNPKQSTLVSSDSYFLKVI